MWYYIDAVYGRSFNRTSLELKPQIIVIGGARPPPAFNRTSLELKLRPFPKENRVASRF